MSSATLAASAGIDPTQLYPLAAACRLVGWGAGALRVAKRRGLNVLYYGRHAFVRGEDLIGYIETHASGERWDNSPRQD